MSAVTQASLRARCVCPRAWPTSAGTGALLPAAAPQPADTVTARGAAVLTCAAHVLHVHHMPKMIQVRHVPDALHRALRARAARAGMTLSDYLRQELEMAADRLTPGELRARLATMSPTVVRERPADAVRRERDAR